MRMDAQPRTRLVKRDVADRPSQGRRGARQIVIVLTRQVYDQLWRDPATVRRRLLGQCECCPELFPAGFGPGFTLDGMLRESKKLPGVRLRKIVLHDDSIYERRPSFALPDMVGSAVARTSNWDDKSGTCLARKRRQKFRERMRALKLWCRSQQLPAIVLEMVGKRVARTDDYAKAYDQPGCHRTSNLVDRLMNRRHRVLYAGRGRHGNQASSERRLPGWT